VLRDAAIHLNHDYKVRIVDHGAARALAALATIKRQER
jgi:hypothetical protein